MIQAQPDERKLATVLFADIAASTSAIEQLDPEGALEFLRPALADMAGAVELFGGTVNRVTGDGMMALFGAPAADEDHAVLACCAALEMLARQERHAGVRLRIGVHSGEFVVHTLQVGALQGIDAAGVAVHMAARLQQHAAAGEAWVSEATVGLGRGRIAGGAAELVRMRGIAAPVPARRLLAADAGPRGGAGGGMRDTSPFLGRDADMARLEGAFRDLGAGRGSAWVVTGEAGIGKSRLLREFVRWIAGGVPALRMSGIRWRRDTGFHALAATLRDDDALAGNAARARALAGLREELQDVVGNVAGPGDGALLPSERRRRRIAAARDALIAWMAGGARLLVVEDAQWLDPDTAEVVRQVVAAVQGQPLLVAMTARQEGGRHGMPGAEELTLAPLEAGSAARLAAALLARHGHGAAASVAAVVARCGGNPFFIEEACALPDPTLMPDAVRPLLAMRVDGVEGQQRALLDLVAALEEPVEVALLAAMAEAAPGDPVLHRDVQGLVDGGFLMVEDAAGPARVACRHALLQEVVYGALTHRRRVELHARICAALEGMGEAAVGQVELLARHARLGQRWQSCLMHSEAAARQALARFANRDAVAHIDHAIAALEALPRDAGYAARAVELRLQLRDPLFRLGRTDALRRRLAEAAELAATLHDSSRLAQLRVFEIHHHWLTGDQDAAERAIGQAQALAQAEGDAALALRTRFQEGLWCLAKGRYGACVAAMEEVAAGAADPVHDGRFGLDPPLVVVALGYSARLRVDLGDLAGAREAAGRCLDWAAKVDRPFSHVFAALADGYVLSGEGAHAAAVGRLEEALAQCGRADADLMRVVCLMLLGVAEGVAGRADAAVARLAGAVAMAAEIGFMVQQPLRLALLARALLEAGAADDARERAEEALGEARRQGDDAAAAHALAVLGRAAAAAGRMEEARARWAEAAERAQRCGLGNLARWREAATGA
jgi:class 3 adenylate cyclase